MRTKKIPAVIAAVVLSATGCTGSAAQEPSPNIPATAATTTTTAATASAATTAMAATATAPTATAPTATAPTATAPTATAPTATAPTAQVRPGRQNCPVTRPGKGPSSVPEESLFGWDSSHGDGKLAVGGLGPEGVIEAGPDFVEQDGSIRMKFGWWRGVPGKFEITGRRLDGSAPNLRADIPDGYGETGFQATGLYFPTEGCWEVTGRIGTTRLIFVTYVTKIATSAD
jgi:hypothetical protein